MTEYIQNAIAQALLNIWESVGYYFRLEFLDPSWYWLGVLVLIYLGTMLVLYFVGAYWPKLRVIAGAMLAILTLGWFVYRKGEADARAHDAKKRQRRDDG